MEKAEIMRSGEERNKLVNENMGLVYACANRFRGRGVDFDDLVQSGCIGLIKAAERFDAGKGFMFSTYAVPAIFGEIKRIFRDGGLVKIGRSDKEKARELMKLREELTSSLGREPTVSELGDASGLSKEYVSVLMGASMPVLSLTFSDDENEKNESDISTGDMTDEIGDGIALRSAVSELPERDRRIVEMRYYSGLTQTVTAKKLGMTQVQVSRREKVILNELRKKLG